MKKQTVKSIVIWTLVWGTLLAVQAYNTQIWSPIQYVKQLFVTPNWELDSSKATIKIDGTNWSIEAKQIYQNGQPLATQNYVDEKTKGIGVFKKIGANAYYKTWSVLIGSTNDIFHGRHPKLIVKNLNDRGSWVTTLFEWNNSITSHFVFQNQNPNWSSTIQVRWKEDSYNWDAPYLDIGISNKTKKGYIGGNVDSIFIDKKVWIWTSDPNDSLAIDAWNRFQWWIDIVWTNEPSLTIKNINSVSNKEWNIFVWWWAWPRWNWKLSFYDRTDDKGVMVLTPSWNVWIWTAVPQAKLEVNGNVLVRWRIIQQSCPSWMYKYWNVCIDATHSATKVNRNTAVVNCSAVGKQLCSIADVTVAMQGGLHNFTNEWLLDFSRNDYYAYIDIPNYWENPEGVDGPNRSKYKYYRCCFHLNP